MEWKWDIKNIYQKKNKIFYKKEPKIMILSAKEIINMAVDVNPSANPILIAAIAMIESSGQVYAMRYEKNYKWIHEKTLKSPLWTEETEMELQKMSWGLMQLMGATARDIGFCGWLTELINPKINIYYASTYINKLFQKYEDQKKVISAYNAGHYTEKNENYVKKVMDIYKSL